MSIPVPFGQYVPGTSPIHRLDARVKLGLVVGYVAVLFASEGWWGLIAALVSAMLAVSISGVNEPPNELDTTMVPVGLGSR